MPWDPTLGRPGEQKLPSGARRHRAQLTGVCSVSLSRGDAGIAIHIPPPQAGLVAPRGDGGMTGATCCPKAGDTQPGDAALTGRGALPAPARGWSHQLQPPAQVGAGAGGGAGGCSAPALACPKFPIQVTQGAAPPCHMAPVPPAGIICFPRIAGTSRHPPAWGSPPPPLPSRPPHLGARSLGSAGGRGAHRSRVPTGARVPARAGVPARAAAAATSTQLTQAAARERSPKRETTRRAPLTASLPAQSSPAGTGRPGCRAPGTDAPSWSPAARPRLPSPCRTPGDTRAQERGVQRCRVPSPAAGAPRPPPPATAPRVGSHPPHPSPGRCGAASSAGLREG